MLSLHRPETVWFFSQYTGCSWQLVLRSNVFAVCCFHARMCSVSGTFTASLLKLHCDCGVVFRGVVLWEGSGGGGGGINTFSRIGMN